jgi:ribonuclease HI
LNRYLIEIYTDGSCHTNYCMGAWAAIILVGGKKILIKGEAQNTTHNRMELLAVIKAVDFAVENHMDASLIIYTDSQYVFRIPERKEKLKRNHFITKKGTPIQNEDLVQALISQIETYTIEFKKIKAHQTHLTADPDIHAAYNSEVDKLVRQMVRDAVKIVDRPTSGF